MYRILLTDDEQIVIDSLSMILNKNFSGQIELFSASSGAKALEIVRENGIDIIFMDIHMPGISGLETISLIRQINPKIVIIILSAYDQFQYAQEALNLGAFKYLTKPVNRNLIVQTARDAMNQIDSARESMTDSIALHQKLSVVSTMVESDFIYSCIFNNVGTDFSEYLNYFGISGKDYFFACIEIPAAADKKYEIYVQVRDILASKSRCITGSFMGDRIGVFFPLTENHEETIQDIYNLLATKISASIKIGVSELESDIKNAQKAYNSAAAALMKIEGSGGLEFSSKERAEKKTLASYEKPAGKIMSAVRAGNTSALSQSVKEFTAALFEDFPDDLDKIKGNIFALIVRGRDCVIQSNAAYTNEAASKAFAFLAGTDSEKALSDFLAERMVEFAIALSAAKEKSANPLVAKAQNYIEQHLSEDVSLEQLSSELQVSPFYLSKLFKEETGDTYINYVTAARLEKSKKLLEDDSLIIKEVAALVGYNDQNYFSKLFRQKFGVTPSEYRSAK